MSGIRWDVAVGGLALGFAFALYLKWQQPDPPAPPSDGAADAAGEAPPNDGAEAPSRGAPAAAPRGTKLPRPVVTRTGGPELLEVEADGEGDGVDPAAPGEDTAPPERFEPGDPALIEAIQETARGLVPDLQECLGEWWAIDPELEGRVVMEFVLDEGGLGEVTLIDHEDVPMGPLSCFGTAVYGGDWPGLTEGETVVAYPFVFTPG